MALFLAVIITVLRGESANLLSVGAIDLGIIVDATVIMVENIFRHLAHHARRAIADREASLTDKLRRILTARGRGRQGDLLLGHHHHRGVPAAVHHAGRGRPDFRSDGAHLCLCAARRDHRDLHGDAGAVVDAAAGAGAARSRPSWCAHIRRVYQVVLPLAVRTLPHRRRRSRRSSCVVCGVLGARLGTEFLPKLEEGNLWIRAVLPPTITLEAGDGDASPRIRNIIMSYRAGADGRLRAGPRRRRAPIPTARSSPNSSCR